MNLSTARLTPLLAVAAAVAFYLGTASSAAADEQGCLACHAGIEDFSDGPMMLAIKGMGTPYGDPGGCVVCHGGDPTAAIADAAHAGTPQGLAAAGGPHMFYPDPGSVWIADQTCGLCHKGYAERLEKALMNTEAGKLQGNLWSWPGSTWSMASGCPLWHRHERKTVIAFGSI